MVNCELVKEYVSALCDGEKIPREAAEHIGSCQSCRQELNEYAAIGLELRRLASLEEPPKPWLRLRQLKEKCIDGITANEKRCHFYLEASVSLATALNPYIGYAKAAEIAKEAVASGRSIIDLAREQKLLSEQQIREILDPVAMTEPRPPLQELIETHEKPVVNDMTIQVATVNGSGSQSSNSVLLRSIFQMGIPVSGKNLFPSNIEGLPTWYTIRANKDGYVARKKEIDFLVAMNRETAQSDVMALASGSAVLYDQPLNLSSLRDDLIFYSVPFDSLVASVCPEAKLRKLVKNMIYVGVLSRLLEIDTAEIEKAIQRQFAKKAKAANLNLAATRAGFDYAAANLVKRDPYRVERMDKTRGKIIIDGNSASALGCVFAGCTVLSWYPITPSSSLAESMIEYLKRFRIGPDGKATFAVVQAEDELAAIGMVVGAGWAGARAMTTTSGPGISLMAEFAGLAYYAEIPAVVWDIQRVGPSTGLPTRTSQADILSTAFLSHGDTKQIMLFPSSPRECFEMAIDAFHLAEQFQTLVFVMSDLDLGMNNWMSDPFSYPQQPISRGKVLNKEDLDRLGSFARYQDVEGDGIGYRTLPGTDHPGAAYFTRGSGHNAQGQYSERPEDYEANMERLNRKFERIRAAVPRPFVDATGSAKIGLIAFGSSHWALEESRDQLRDEHGLATDYLRIRAFPFGPEIADFVRSHERVYVVEQNRDAQMLSLLKIELDGELVSKLRSVARLDGLPMDARSVTDEIVAMERRCMDARSVTDEIVAWREDNDGHHTP